MGRSAEGTLSVGQIVEDDSQCRRRKKNAWSEGLMVWDELNTAGNLNEQREIAHAAIFGVTSASTKERFEKFLATDPLRTVLISMSWLRSVAERFSSRSNDDGRYGEIMLTLVVPETPGGV